MLIIYDHQIERLDEYYVEPLVAQVHEHLRVHFPDDFHRMETNGRDAFIRDGIRAGRLYGLTTDRNLTLFVDFRVTFGSTFPEEQEWATLILHDDTLLEDEKLEQLLDQLDESE